MTVTKVDRGVKLKKWSHVQDEILHKLNQGDDGTRFNIHFGPQHEHTFKHPNPLRCMTNFHTTMGEVFVTHHGKGGANQINVWSLMNSSQEIKLQKIKNEAHVNMQELMFIPRHRVFVAFCQDMTLRVFSDVVHSFQEMNRTRMARTVTSMVYNRETDELIIGGQGFVQWWQLEVHEMVMELVRSSKHDIDLAVDEWVIELRIDPKNKQLLVLCDHGVYVLDYLTRETKHYLHNRHDTCHTCCTFFSKRDYFITASKEGSIKVWNMILFTQVHDFRGHYEPVTSMQVHAPEIMLISGSIDGTIRLWSLETFELFYRLDVLEPVHRLTLLMNSDELFYSTEHDIKILKLNLFSSLFSVVQSQVQKLSRVSAWGYYPSRILASALDGGVRILSPVTGALITIIYPMNTTEVWTNYVYDRRSNKLFVVLKCGEVMIFDCSTNPCIAGQILEPHTHDEEILSVALINLDKEFDGERVTETLVFAGLKDGKISLLNAETSNMEKSVQGHSGKVTLLEVSICDGGNHAISRCDRLLSAGTDHRIKIWSVAVKSETAGSLFISILKVIACNDTPKFVAMVGSMVFAAMSEKSVLAAYSVDTEDQTVSAITHSEEDEHTDDITGMDICPGLSILATTGDDGVVKIWNFNNELIQEMSFNSTLKGVCFANKRGDLLVGLQNHVYSISITNYLPMYIIDRIVMQNFDDDIIEQPIEFICTKKVNLDVNMVPVYPADLQKRREVMVAEYKDRLRQMPIEYEPLLLDNKSEIAPVGGVKKVETVAPPTAHVQQSKTISKKPSAKVRAKKTALKADDVNEPIKQDDSEVEVEGETEGHVQGEQLEQTKDENGDKEKQDVGEEKKARLPVAPDARLALKPSQQRGFIPNSVVRKLYNIKPPEIIHTQDTFKLRTFPTLDHESALLDSDDDPTEPESVERHPQTSVKHRLKNHQKNRKPYNPMVIKQNRQILMLSLMGKAMDGVARQLTGDVKRFIWHEGENEIIQSSSEEETEEPIIETEDPVKKRKPKVPKKKVGFQVVQPTPLKTEKRIAEGAALIEEEEVEEEDEEVDDIHELLRMIATEKWFPRGKEISPENTLEVLMRLLERASTPIRRDVMKYIGEFYRTFGLAADKKGQIITTLQGLLQHENVFIRVGAVKLLGELGLARRDIILGLLPMLVHEEHELRGTAVATFKKLTGVMNKDGLLHLLTDLGVIGRQEDGYLIEDAALQILANNLGQGECDARNDSVTLGEDGGASPAAALPILSKNRGLREDRASHSIVVNGTFSDLIESWVNGLDSSQRDDLYDPLAKASHTEGFGPDGQPLSATSSFESVGASPREPDLGDGKGKKRTAPDRSMTVCISGQDAAAAAAVDRTSGSISSSPKVTLLDRSTDSLNAARRGIIGPLEAAESRKRVRRQRRSESKATDNMSIDGSTTSMSGAGFSGTYDYSDQKQKQRKDSLGRLAESYRQKSQDALDKKQRKDSLGRLAQTYRKKSLGLQGSKTQSSAERSSIKGSEYRQNSQEFMKLRRQNSADGTSMKDSLYRQNSQEVLRSRGENSTGGTSMNDSLYRQNSQEVLGSRRQNSAESVDSFEKGRKGEDRDSDIYSASFGLGSQLLDDGRSQKTGQTGVGLKSDDSGIGQFSDSDSHMTGARDKYGRNLAGRFAPPMSPVSDGTVELEQGEPNWRQLFDDPLTIEGLPHMEQRRVNADQLRRTRDAMNARHSINFPPIRYLGENEKLLPGEAGQRLLHSIQVKAGPGKSPDSKSKWYRIDAIPGRLGLHTSTEDSGTSKFGILKMKWTTDMPHYDPYAYQKLPLGYYTIPGGTLPKIQKASQTRNIPIARPTSPGTKLTSLPFIDVPIPISKARYEWDRPMPPAPPRRSRMDLPIIRTEHDRYCQYYKIAKEKEEERKQEAMKLPTITPTRSGTLGVVPSPASSHQQSPRELEELELPPITAGMILGAEC